MHISGITETGLCMEVPLIQGLNSTLTCYYKVRASVLNREGPPHHHPEKGATWTNSPARHGWVRDPTLPPAHKPSYYTTHAHTHLRLVEVFITHKLNMIWEWNLHWSTSLANSQKALEAHGCKSWVTNFLIDPSTLGILTANITYCIILLEYVNECQVNTHVV